MTQEQDAQKMQELQLLEQNMQNLLMQKQAFQMELSETEAAIAEIKKSGDQVYKVIGQLMIQSKKDDLKKELEDKLKLLETRMKSIEKQESGFSGKIQELREEVMKSMEKKK